MTIRVLIADDDALVRVSLTRAFARHDDFEVVGEAVDGEEAVSMARSQDPDVIVMDLQMPKLSGLEATERLRAMGISTPILFLTADATATIDRDHLDNVELLIKAKVGVLDTVKAVRAAAGAG